MSYAEFARALARRWICRGVEAGGRVVLRQTTSTHLLGRRIAAEYSQEHAVPPSVDVVAWQQTAGMGREGRSWSSPPGGVYATMIRPIADGVAVQTLPLLVATALCDALNRDLDGRCRLKWPNDLLVAGGKLGGILIDAASRGAGGTGGMAVISFGVNHSQVEEPGATSLEREAVDRVPLADLIGRLFDALDDALTVGDSAAEIADRYRQLSLHRPGDALCCRLHGDRLEGIFLGFDEHGFLRLQVGEEERLLTAGEVTDEGDFLHLSPCGGIQPSDCPQANR